HPRRLPRGAPLESRRDRALPRTRLRVCRAAARLLPGCRRSRGRARVPARTRRAAGMSAAPGEVARRRSFAIISHPDAGKTTLTEKLLLFGGAIQMAGT